MSPQSSESNVDVTQRGALNTRVASSRVAGFYKWSREERAEWLKRSFDLTDEELIGLGALIDERVEPSSAAHYLNFERADKMVENCIGTLSLPVGLGLNFIVNGRDYVIPMAVEEPSVIAAVSHVARIVRETGGFSASSDKGVMIAQIQVVGCDHLERAAEAVRAATEDLCALADNIHPNLKRRGGGARGVEARVINDPHPMLIVHLLIDCVDAMGANAVNTIAEGLAPTIESLTGGKVYLRILSNLSDRRLARAQFKVPESLLALRAGDAIQMEGSRVAEGIVYAYQFADVDPYRAATHNKGIMNGVDAVVIATGNDWRSVEAGAHAYAARDGQYRSLTRFWREDGYLHGAIEIPMAVATVGGSTQVHPTIKVLRKILNIESAQELAQVCAAVGLAQNLGALKALATEGIQRGHMSLHARSVALSVGAEGDEVDQVAAALIEQNQVKHDLALGILEQLRRHLAK